MVLENLTLFEVHLDDLDLGERRGGTGTQDRQAAPSSDDEEEEDSGGGRSRVALVVAMLAAVAVVALAVRRYRGGDEEEAEPIAVADDEAYATGRADVPGGRDAGPDADLD